MDHVPAPPVAYQQQPVQQVAQTHAPVPVARPAIQPKEKTPDYTELLQQIASTLEIMSGILLMILGALLGRYELAAVFAWGFGLTGAIVCLFAAIRESRTAILIVLIAAVALVALLAYVIVSR